MKPRNSIISDSSLILSVMPCSCFFCPVNNWSTRDLNVPYSWGQLGGIGLDPRQIGTCETAAIESERLSKSASSSLTMCLMFRELLGEMGFQPLRFRENCITFNIERGSSNKMYRKFRDHSNTGFKIRGFDRGIGMGVIGHGAFAESDDGTKQQE
jgi:hypothetical protein